jgi:hypothetical protein
MKLKFKGSIGNVEPVGDRYPGWLRVYVWIDGAQPAWNSCDHKELLSLHIRSEDFRGLVGGDAADVEISIDLKEAMGE